MSDPPNEIITLRSGDARLAVAPFLGGSLLGYWWETGGLRHDWLVASREAGIAGFRELRLASFPLVPFSNRIREGRFAFRGRTVAEPIAPRMAHAIHGHGWRLPWQVTERHDDQMKMEYEWLPAAAPEAWPWRYRAWQRLELTPQALTLTIGIENRSDDAMPAGLGHHPYFPRSSDSRVDASVAAIWWPETGQLPEARVAPPAEADPRQGVVPANVQLDHAYAGWDGSAVIEWPARGARLAMNADPALSTLVIFSPPDASFFCVEPVSHCVDAFNLAERGVGDTGMVVLAPGEAWQAMVRFTPTMVVPLP